MKRPIIRTDKSKPDRNFRELHPKIKKELCKFLEKEPNQFDYLTDKQIMKILQEENPSPEYDSFTGEFTHFRWTISMEDSKEAFKKGYEQDSVYTCYKEPLIKAYNAGRDISEEDRILGVDEVEKRFNEFFFGQF